MRQLLKSLQLIRISFGLVTGLILCAISSPALGQQPPLVYTVENTGVNLPAPVIPDFAHLPIVRQLPDPFVFFDGTRDTSWAAFEQHRNEWMAAIEQNEIGPKPNCTGSPATDSVLGVGYTCTVAASYVMTTANHYTLTVKVTVTPTATGTPQILTWTDAIVLPTPSTSCVQPANGWPYVMGMGNAATGSWPASAFNASVASPTGVTVKPTGCAATVAYNDNVVAAYTGGRLVVHNTDGFYKLYPNLCAGLTTAGTTGACNAANGFPNGSNSGEYAAWSWGISRLIDAIQLVSSSSYCSNNAGACAGGLPLPLDTTHSATSGCSYAGKMALWGGALDERVALTISQENGGGGAPSWRISHEIETQGSVEDINDTDYDWFDSSMQQYNWLNAYKMPTDHFELMAMVAPRGLLQTGDSEYYWLGDRSATFDSMATDAIYTNYGISDRFNYYMDTVHFHCQVPAYQQNATQPIINRFMFGSDVATGLKVPEQFEDALQPGVQPTWDPKFWTSWWGTNTPAFPEGEAWNSGGNVMLPLKQDLTLNTGDTITSQFQVTMPGTHGAGTVTVPTSFTEIDVACTDGTSYSFSVPPVPTSYYSNNQAFTIAANDNSVFPSTVATATNPGCSNGAPGHTTGTYFFALGKTNPGAGNPGLAGFVTTDGLQASGQTDPLNVTFNLADSSTGQGGTWAPWTTINNLNPYSCTPPGCPLTPTIAWSKPADIIYGTPLGSTQLDAAASSTLISGWTGTGGTSGEPVTAPITGTSTYNPPAGTVLSPGVNTLAVSFVPANVITSTTTAANAYKTYTIATASVPLTVSYGVCLLYNNTHSVNSGATVPIKIALCDVNGNDVSSSSVVVHAVSLTQISSSASQTLDSPGSANPDNDFRFDPTLGTSGGYIYNLQTTGLATGTYAVGFTAGADPVTHTVTFQVR